VIEDRESSLRPQYSKPTRSSSNVAKGVPIGTPFVFLVFDLTRGLTAAFDP